MATTNLADRSLTTAARRLTTGRRAERLTARWADDAHLDGWTPSGLLVALTKRDHPDHDTLVRGLVTHSQRRDEDATLLLLIALRPAIWKLAHTYHRPRLHAALAHQSSWPTPPAVCACIVRRVGARPVP